MTKMIGAELLRSFSAGIALADPQSQLITFANPAFSSWFSTRGKGDVLAEVLPGLAEAAVEVGEDDAITFEARVRRRRRELIIEVTVRRAIDEGRDVLVLECQNISRLRETEAMIDTYASLSEKRVRELEADKARIAKRAVDLAPPRDRQTAGATQKPTLFEPVTALMVDFVDLHERVHTADPAVIMAELGEIFAACEELAETHDCLPIKSFGDTFIAVAGMPDPDPDQALNAARCAVAIMRHLEIVNAAPSQPWRARVAIATGTAIGSMAGPQKHVFDVFGSALEQANRIQSACAPMEILVSASLVDTLMEDFVFSASRSASTPSPDQDLRAAALDHRQARARIRRT